MRLIFLILVIAIILIKLYRPLENFDVCDTLKKKDYFNKFNKIDYQVRNLTKGTIDDVYCNNVNSLTNKEKVQLDSYIKEIENKTNSPNFFRDIKVYKINDKIERGLPHTREDVILLPNDIFNNTKKVIFNLLVHEQTHILQKKHPDIFKKLYLDYWNFIKVADIINKDHLVSRVRSNPDGMDLMWIYCKNNKYIWFLSIYRDNPSMYNVDYIGIYLEKVGEKFKVPKNYIYKKILDIPEFNEMFNISNNHYHPNEICAEIFSNYYLSLMGISNFDSSIPGNAKFMSWYNKNIDLIKI